MLSLTPSTGPWQSLIQSPHTVLQQGPAFISAGCAATATQCLLVSLLLVAVP